MRQSWHFTPSSSIKVPYAGLFCFVGAMVYLFLGVKALSGQGQDELSDTEMQGEPPDTDTL